MMTTSHQSPNEGVRRHEGAPGEGSAPNKEVGSALPPSAQGSTGDLPARDHQAILDLLDGLVGREQLPAFLEWLKKTHEELQAWGLWTRVVDSLPDDGLSVLTCRAGDADSVEVGGYNSELSAWWDVHGEDLDEPTHWMHLPEVPLEEVAP
jgi:hypothetical protein